MKTSTPMTTKTIGQLVAERPERARVFEQFGIDYCCGGRKPLAEVCAQQGLDAQHVRSLLEAVDTDPVVTAGRDWSTAPLSQLADHIESTHHRLMRMELPRAGALMAKVAAVHGKGRPELRELNRIFEAFSSEMIDHMRKEDDIVFPWIRDLEAGRTPDNACRGRLDHPISRMVHEHDDAGKSLRRMRELTCGFKAPPDACGTYRVMLSTLEEIEADMHVHVHKENNILFPRALGLGSSCCRPS